MTIPEHRQAIDKLDAQLVKLLNERTKHVLGIGAIKLRHGEEIYAPHRERQVLQRIIRRNNGPITNDSLKAIYREIMSSALALEKSMHIAYLGPEATFTHQAAIQRFGSSLRYAAQKTIADVFNEVAKGRADYGVVPVENSTEGVVTHTLDMFVDSDLKIVSQIVLPISHCLVSRVQRSQIKKLFVHPQTLAQCRSWIHRTFPHAELIETSSNARSAELAATERNSGAIAGLLAAEKYRVPVLEHDIQDNSANATRFLVLGRKCSPRTGSDRTSIMVRIEDKAGALDRILALFRRRRLNLIKIESPSTRPDSRSCYIFLDFNGHADDSKVTQMLSEMPRYSLETKVLGTYPNVEKD